MSVFQMTAKSGMSSEVPEAGNQPAVLVALLDLGTHKVEYKGAEAKWVRKVLLVWELTTAPNSNGGNHILARDFTLSFVPKAKLREVIESWRGKAFAEGESFDLSKLLGQKCLLNVQHGTAASGRTYAKVANVTSPIKGMVVPDPKRELVAWSISSGEAAPAGDWPFIYGEPIEDFIARSKERAGVRGTADSDDELEVGEVPNDDSPF